MTREEMIAERDNKAKAVRDARKPEISAHRVNGGVRLVVAYPTPEIRAVLAQHGFTLVVGILATYERTFPTPADLQVAQDALRGFFGR